MEWIMDNLMNIVVVVVVFGLALAVIIKMIRDKAAGKTSCGCGCDACGHATCSVKKFEKMAKEMDSEN